MRSGKHTTIFHNGILSQLKDTSKHMLIRTCSTDDAGGKISLTSASKDLYDFGLLLWLFITSPCKDGINSEDENGSNRFGIKS